MPYLDENRMQYTKYNWEFLRRNPEYIRDWENLQNILEDKYKDWYPPFGKIKEETDFCKKWKIWNPFPPEKIITYARKYRAYVISL